MTKTESYLLAAAELEKVGFIGEANKLRIAAQQHRTVDPAIAERREQLKQQIAEFEADGRYGSAMKLKTELAKLAQ